MRRCKNCILPETYPNIKFNSNGICNYCSGEQHFGITGDPKIQKLMTRKEELRKDFEKFVEECRGEGEYDCLLLLSGGKDSSYLLYLLKQEYGLNVLALSVDTGLLSPLAKPNIKRVVEHLNVDHIFFKPKHDFFKRLYCYYLTHPSNRTYCDTICEVCSNAIHGIGMVVATQKEIPFITLGYSPDETDHYFYEIPKKEISRSWVPKKLYDESFDEKDRNYFWNPSKGNNFPRVFLPFHVIEYPGMEETIRKISELGLIEKRKAHPLATNCYLWWLLMYLDIKKVGYNPYVRCISDLIINGKASRNRWLLTVRLGNWLLKSGIAKRGVIKYVLRHLDLEMKDILSEKNAEEGLKDNR